MNKKRSNFLVAGGIGGLALLLILFIYEMIVLASCNSIGVLCLVFGIILFDPASSILMIFGLNYTGYPLIITSILFWFIIGFLLGMLVYKLYLIKNE